MNAIKAEVDKMIKKIVGINFSNVRRITFDDHHKFLRANFILSHHPMNIRLRLHVLRTETQTMISLSHHDDKSYLLKGSMDTLPWRHYSLIFD